MTVSGLGRLCALDTETFGRWGTDRLWIAPALAREHSRELPLWLRRDVLPRLLSRWLSLLAVAIQRRVSHACLRAAGADVAGAISETGRTCQHSRRQLASLAVFVALLSWFGLRDVPEPLLH